MRTTRRLQRLLECVLALGAVPPALAGVRPDSGLEARPRFLLLSAFRESTLVGKLEKASTAGYRVIAGVGRRHLVVEKTPVSEGVYQYRFAGSREEVKQAGLEGLRLLPLVKAWRGDKEEEYEQVFLMERPPGSGQRWEYTDAPKSAQSRVVRMTLGRLYFYGHLRNSVVIMETPIGGVAEAEPKPDNFRALSAESISNMEDRLREAAQAGWRVIAASDGALELLIQKGDPAGRPADYIILATKRAGSMQKLLNESGSRGFRLLPAAIGTFRKEVFSMEGLVSETFVVMEKAPGAATFGYWLVTSQQELNKADSLGYQVVAMKDFYTHNGVVFLERTLPPASAR